jgi:hypothetical protein
VEPLSGLRRIRCPDNGRRSLLRGLVASYLLLAAFARLARLAVLTSALLIPALLAGSLLGLSAALALGLNLWLGLRLSATLLPRLLLTAVFVMTHASSLRPRFAAESGQDATGWDSQNQRTRASLTLRHQCRRLLGPIRTTLGANHHRDASGSAACWTSGVNWKGSARSAVQGASTT